MVQPQNRRSNNNAIMDQIRRLLGLKRMLVVLNAAAFLPHLNLAVDHLCVKAKVALACEETVLQVDALYSRMIGAGPHAHLVIRRQQRCGLVGGHGGHLVLVHLVQVDGVVLCAEEVLAYVCELHRRVGELPSTGRSRFDGAAEHAAQDLVAKADA